MLFRSPLQRPGHLTGSPLLAGRAAGWPPGVRLRLLLRLLLRRASSRPLARRGVGCSQWTPLGSLLHRHCLHGALLGVLNRLRTSVDSETDPGPAVGPRLEVIDGLEAQTGLKVRLEVRARYDIAATRDTETRSPAVAEPEARARLKVSDILAEIGRAHV